MGLLNIFKRSKSSSMAMPPPLSHDSGELPELPPLEDNGMHSLDEPRGVSEPIGEPPQVAKVMPEPHPVEELTQAEEDEGMPHDLKHHTIGGSIFLNVDDYRTILDHAEGVKEKIKDAERVLHKLHELKEKRQLELRKWQGNVADIQRKLAYVDKALFERKH